MSGSLRGVTVAPSPQWWPQKAASAILTYAYDMTDWLIAAGGDALATVNVSIPWSLSGDAQVTQIAVEGSVISVQVAGGWPGKTYAVGIAGTTLFGNTFSETTLLTISAPFVEAGAPVPTPPATSAATLTWGYLPSLDFSDARNSMYL